MVIFIRHGEDNGTCGKYSHDMDISENSKKDIASLTHKLVKKYGIPDVIYCSPFKRCRSTVKVMQEHFHTETETQVIIDNRLSKYYTKKQQQNPNARPSTLKYNPPTSECYCQVLDRSIDIYKELKNKSDNVWCISHGIVLRYISKKIGEEIRNIKFLHILKV